MTRLEITGRRDLTFSRWHRYHPALGPHATAQDLDLLGYCHRCAGPLYVVESTRQEEKDTRVLNAAASLLRVPAILVRYSTTPQRACPGCACTCHTQPRLVELRAHYAPVINGRRQYIGHELELVDELLQIRSDHRCEEIR